jgi:hypothetical protein
MYFHEKLKNREEKNSHSYKDVKKEFFPYNNSDKINPKIAESPLN